MTIAAAILLAGSAAAGAADLTRNSTASIKDGPSTAATGWTGPYIGVHGGYTMMNHDMDLAAKVDGEDAGRLATERAGNGGTIGVIAGYDHVLATRLMVGVYVEYDVTNSESATSGAVSGYGSGTGRLSQGDMFVLGGRIGTFVNGALVFVNAGYAHTEFTNAVSVGGDHHSITEAADGVLVGGGVEMPLGAGWFATAKYDHTFFDGQTWMNESVGDATATVTGTPDVDRVMVGLSWKFGR
jgi:outer membrane immunogenic protein